MMNMSQLPQEPGTKGWHKFGPLRSLEMTWWICFTDKLFASTSRYKSCCDEEAAGKWSFVEPNLKPETWNNWVKQPFTLWKGLNGCSSDFWSLTSFSLRGGLDSSSANFEVNPWVQAQLCCYGNTGGTAAFLDDKWRCSLLYSIAFIRLETADVWTFNEVTSVSFLWLDPWFVSTWGYSNKGVERAGLKAGKQSCKRSTCLMVVWAELLMLQWHSTGRRIHVNTWLNI